MQKNIHCQTQLGVTQGEWVKRFFGMFWKGKFEQKHHLDGTSNKSGELSS